MSTPIKRERREIFPQDFFILQIIGWIRGKTHPEATTFKNDCVAFLQRESVEISLQRLINAGWVTNIDSPKLTKAGVKKYSKLTTPIVPYISRNGMRWVPPSDLVTLTQYCLEEVSRRSKASQTFIEGYGDVIRHPDSTYQESVNDFIETTTAAIQMDEELEVV